MRQLLLVPLLSLTFTAAAEAKVACFESTDSFTLTPTNVVTLDGLLLQRAPTTGLFTADGGIEFDVNTSRAIATSIACGGEVAAFELTAVDPFAGPDAGPLTLTVRRP